MASPVAARFMLAVDKRDGGVDRLVVTTNRGLKSGKFDVFDLTPKQARTLAMELLVAADRFERDQ